MGQLKKETHTHTHFFLIDSKDIRKKNEKLFFRFIRRKKFRI